MAKNLIERAEEPRTARNEHNGAPAILKHAANIIQRSQVVRQVLDHIQTDDGVKFLFLGKRFAVLAVGIRSEEHTSELQSHHDLVCRLLLEKKNQLRPWRTELMQRQP